MRDEGESSDSLDLILLFYKFAQTGSNIDCQTTLLLTIS